MAVFYTAHLSTLTSIVQYRERTARLLYESSVQALAELTICGKQVHKMHQFEKQNLGPFPIGLVRTFTLILINHKHFKLVQLTEEHPSKQRPTNCSCVWDQTFYFSRPKSKQAFCTNLNPLRFQFPWNQGPDFP